jgi:hypothetical protein
MIFHPTRHQMSLYPLVLDCENHLELGPSEHRKVGCCLRFQVDDHDDLASIAESKHRMEELTMSHCDTTKLLAPFLGLFYLLHVKNWDLVETFICADGLKSLASA